MVLNDRKDERMALNKKGGLGKGLGKGIDSLISNAYAVETKKKDSAADKKEPDNSKAASCGAGIFSTKTEI